MKKSVADSGSTGSIGRTSLDIFKKDSKKFNIILLSANSNYSLIMEQIKKFKPKYFIINDFFLVFNKVNKNNKNLMLKFITDFQILK